MVRILVTLIALTLLTRHSLDAADKPLKVFILAGQSNMVGWGDSLKLPDELRTGNDRVLMFEDNRWQPLKPFRKTQANQQQVGMTEFSFGPEIAFGHAMAEAWPDETIGVIKFAIGGTSVLTWKPDWSKEDADRVNQGRLGSLYEKLITKIREARKTREIEIVGFLWNQGGGDMKKLDVAQEYLENFESLVLALRKETGVADLPVFIGTSRRDDHPDDLTEMVPERIEGPYPFGIWVLKAQWQAQSEIPHCKAVILRDIETHPMNVHYNTAGQLMVGKLFADAVIDVQKNRD